MHSHRSAFTLLELILVMALIVIVGALVYPSLAVTYDQYKVTAAADAIRSSWAIARGQAMEHGRPYRFAIVPGHGNYRVAPDSAEYWSGNDIPTSDNPSGHLVVVSETLPKGVIFGGDNSSSNGDDTESLSPDEVDPASWKTVAVFLPDGTAREDVQLILSSRRSAELVVRLRAMTGAVTVRRNTDQGGR